MNKKIYYNYNDDLDIIHVYSEDLDNGIRGCLNFGDFNIDIGEDDRILGVEIEGASNLLGLSSNILSNLTETNLIIKKSGNILLIGIFVAKGNEKSRIMFNFDTQNFRNQIKISN